MKSKIVYMIMVCLLCITALNLRRVEAANSWTMKLDGTEYKGTTEETVIFNMSPKKSGMVKMKVTYKSSSLMKATLKNLSTNVETTFESKFDSQDSVIEFTYYAEPDKYQLVVDFINGNNTTNYVAVAELTAVTSGEGTKGKTMTEAVELTYPDQVGGVLGFGDSSDCYKIVLNSSRDLPINIKNFGPESINVMYYDTYQQLIKLEIIPTFLGLDYEIPKANGVYYVVMSHIYTNGLGINYALTVGDFVPVTSIKFAKKSLTLTEGTSKTLKASVTPSNSNEKYTYKSSNKKIAKVDSKGKITAIKAGTATITVTSVSGKKATCKVTVTKKRG